MDKINNLNQNERDTQYSKLMNAIQKANSTTHEIVVLTPDGELLRSPIQFFDEKDQMAWDDEVLQKYASSQDNHLQTEAVPSVLQEQQNNMVEPDFSYFLEAPTEMPQLPLGSDRSPAAQYRTLPGNPMLMGADNLQQGMSPSAFPAAQHAPTNGLVSLPANGRVPGQMNAVQMVQTVPYGSEKSKPYDLMKKIMQTCRIRVLGQDVYYYSGTHYKKARQQDIERLIMGVCRTEVMNNGTPSLVKKTYALLLMEPTLAVDDLQMDRYLVSFENVLFRLGDGRMINHSPDYFTTYTLNCSYLPGAHLLCPNFDKYIQTVTQGDMVLAERILQMIGYCLTPDTSAKAVFLLQGVPNSGKSLLSDFLRDCFPPDRVSSVDVHTLGQRFKLSELEGKSLNISPDLSAEALDPASVSNIKKLTGNDVVSADKKYADSRTYQFEGKFILATNYPLVTKLHDEAFDQRIVTIPFMYAVPSHERDTDLRRKLAEEREVIVVKAMDAYFKLRNSGYQFAGYYPMNDERLLGKGHVMERMDPYMQVYAFAKLFFEHQEDGIVEVDMAHQMFCEQYGQIAKNAFSERFKQFVEELYGAEKLRSRNGIHENPVSCIKGIRLRA